VRVMIAEDSVLLREGLGGLLARFGFDVVASVGDADALVKAVAKVRPDLVVTDVRMPPGFTDEGLRAAVALRVTDPDLPVVALSQYVQHSYAAELLGSGQGRAIGYLLKDRVADVGDFLDALTRVAGGATVLDPEVVTQIMGASRRVFALETLTGREQQVLRLMAEGRSNSAIAAALTVSAASVEKYVSSIFAKLGLPPSDTDHRRVLAVLRYLGSTIASQSL
jgi:DNA-binding NarL/FixJ family response regulator